MCFTSSTPLCHRAESREVRPRLDPRSVQSGSSSFFRRTAGCQGLSEPTGKASQGRDNHADSVAMASASVKHASQAPAPGGASNDAYTHCDCLVQEISLPSQSVGWPTMPACMAPVLVSVEHQPTALGSSSVQLSCPTAGVVGVAHASPRPELMGCLGSGCSWAGTWPR